jgi:predicted porin
LQEEAVTALTQFKLEKQSAPREESLSSFNLSQSTKKPHLLRLFLLTKTCFFITLVINSQLRILCVQITQVNYMKNFLLVSTLIAAPILANAAEAPKVKLGGRMDTMAGYVNQEKKYRTTNPSLPENKLHKGAIVNDTTLDINIDGKTTQGLKYGGLIRLHADTSTATNKETSLGDKTMVFMQHDKIGRLEVGNMPGAGGLFEMDLTFFNRGTWGVDGFWSQWVTDRTFRTTNIANKSILSSQTDLRQKLRSFETRGVEFVASPNLPSNYSGNHYSDAPKASFFTKPITNLTLGISFIPDMDSTGTISGIAGKNTGPVFDAERASNPPSFKDIVSGGMMYDIDASKDVKIRTSLVGEVGRAKNLLIRDLSAMEAGLVFIYKEKLKFAGSYGNWGKSLTLKNPVAGAKQKAEYWTAGIGYEYEKIGTSLTYMGSKKAGGIEAITTQPALAAAFQGGLLNKSEFSDFKTNDLRNIVLDVDYKLAPGFLPYVGISNFEFKESTGSKDKGFVFMGGTRLLF